MSSRCRRGRAGRCKQPESPPREERAPGNDMWLADRPYRVSAPPGARRLRCRTRTLSAIEVCGVGRETHNLIARMGTRVHFHLLEFVFHSPFSFACRDCGAKAHSDESVHPAPTGSIEAAGRRAEV